MRRLLLVAVVLLGACGDDGTARSAPVAVESPPHVERARPRVIAWPATHVEAKAILGASRATVRAALGQQPKTTERDRDFFVLDEIGTTVYYSAGQAVALIINSTVAPVVEADARLWLGLPSDLRLTLGKNQYDITMLDGTFAIREVRWAQKQDYLAIEKHAKEEALLDEKDSAAECTRNKDARTRAAAAFAKGWLEQGQDVYASAEDPCGRTLRVQWPLCSRPTVYNLINSDMGKLLKSAGFTRVTCYDGIDATWRDIF